MLSKKYLKWILEGRKRATIRPGIKRISDGEVYIHSDGKIAARARISQVYYKKFGELNDVEAKLEGYEDGQTLKQELKKLYPRIKDDDWVTVLVLEDVEPLDLPEDAKYMGKSPVEIAREAISKLKLSRREYIVLRAVLKYGSLRKASIALFGSIEKRRIIRRILRKALRKLTEGD